MPNVSLDFNTLSPSKSLSPSNPLPLHELLLLSPSPLRRSRTRLTERMDVGEESLEAAGSRRRCKTRTSQMGALGCASPRNARRPRRRMEQDLREDKDLCVVEEMGKARKRRHSGRSRKEKLSLVPSVPSSSSSPSGSKLHLLHLFFHFCFVLWLYDLISSLVSEANDDDLSNLYRLGQLLNDLIMWKDTSKSSFWFGFGCVCFLSSCFTRGISFRYQPPTAQSFIFSSMLQLFKESDVWGFHVFSIFSAISQLGLLVLGLSFFSNTLHQR